MIEESLQSQLRWLHDDSVVPSAELKPLLKMAEVFCPAIKSDQAGQLSFTAHHQSADHAHFVSLRGRNGLHGKDARSQSHDGVVLGWCRMGFLASLWPGTLDLVA